MRRGPDPCTTSLQRLPTRLEWGFGLRWVLATSVGWVVGFAACETLKAIAEFLAHPPTDGAVIGIFIGIAQWLVLKGRIHRAGWWILASIIGFGLGKASMLSPRRSPERWALASTAR